MCMNELRFGQINLTRAMLISCFCLSMLSVADAGSITAPSELKPGDAFRLIFVTSGKINATSNDIRDYDRFVNEQAQGATYGGATIHFTAIVSLTTTATNPPLVTAINHINFGGNSRPIAGVFMADGTIVATNSGRETNGLFSGHVLTNPNLGIDATVYNDVQIWTGSAGNCHAYRTTRYGYYGLGSTNDGRLLTDPNPTPYFSSPVAEVGYLGTTNATSYSWLSRGGIPGVQPTSLEFQMYAISDVLTVVPEPSSLIGVTLGSLILAAHHWVRCRQSEVNRKRR